MRFAIILRPSNPSPWDQYNSATRFHKTCTDCRRYPDPKLDRVAGIAPSQGHTFYFGNNRDPDNTFYTVSPFTSARFFVLFRLLSYVFPYLQPYHLDDCFSSATELRQTTKFQLRRIASSLKRVAVGEKSAPILRMCHTFFHIDRFIGH